MSVKLKPVFPVDLLQVSWKENYEEWKSFLHKKRG